MATLSKEGVGGRENWHSGENKATTKRGKRRGRQKDLPDFVPRLNENMANGLEFKSGFSKAASCIIKEDQAKRRKQKQDERARAIAEQRERNRDTQLIAATTQAKQKAEAHIKAEEEQLARRKKKAQELDQLLVSLRAGDVKQEEFPLEYADRIQRIVKRKVPHTTEADRHHIRELAGEFTQVEIARKTGFTQSTISNALNRKKGQSPRWKSEKAYKKRWKKKLLDIGSYSISGAVPTWPNG